MIDDDEDKKSNLNSIFKGLDKFINLIADMIESNKDQLNINGDINKDKLAGKYGFNIKLGSNNLNGIDRINEINKRIKNVQKKMKPIEPSTDIFDEEDKVIIVMELPGIKDDEIQLDINNNIITIRASGTKSNFYKNISLKFTPKTEDITAKLNNSIYSIIINKQLGSEEV